MKEAMGGILSLNLILIFLVIISCYLAFSVNYTKTFRVKNEIRSIIEKNEGLTCDALKQIEKLMEDYNYEGRQMCPGGGDWFLVTQPTIKKGSFCYKVQAVDKYGTYEPDELYKGAYYTVGVYINIVDFPILNGTATGINDLWAFLSQPFFVTGETSLIYSSGVRYEGLPSCGTS